MVTTPEGTKNRADRTYAPREAARAWRKGSGFKNPYVASRRGPRLRSIVMFLGLLLLLLVIDGIIVATSIQGPLREAARHLDEGVDSLQEGDIPSARTSFDAAVHESRTAEALAGRPSVLLTSYTPWLSRDADAIRALTRSARLFAVAGVNATDAVEVLGGTSRNEIAASLYNRGQLQFETIGRAQVFLAEVAENLTAARDLLDEVGLPRIQRLADAVETARDRIEDVEPRAVAAARLLDALPRMMGRDEPRRYFVALQAQSEARATGGSIGLYGVMEADQGRIRLTHVGPAFELAEAPRKPLSTGILLPAWYAARYGDDVNLGNVNRSPHFPLTARAILQMYRNSTGQSLDGVWSFDPLAFQYVTSATGPLRGPGFDVPLGPDNAAEVLLKDAYLHFGTRWIDQTQFLIGIIQDLYAHLGSRDADTAGLFEGLAEAAGGNHFKIYSTDPTEQQTLVDLGLDGGIDLDGPPAQLVFHNNLEGNKVDYFLRRTVDASIRLTAEGGARVTTTIRLRNGAPSGPPSVLLGFPQRGERPGFNRMELNVVLPEGASDVTGQVRGLPTDFRLGQEGSFPLASVELDIPPGGSTAFTVTYSIEEVQRFLETARDFRFLLTPQPTAIPDHYVVTVLPPDGYFLIRGGPSSGRRATDAVSFEGELETPTTIRVSVVKT